MNEHTIKGNWKELKGKVKEQWGRLTDDEIDQIDGKKDQLAGAIQKHYGRTVDEANSEISKWESGDKH
ncbi:MAG: CsbD family protein [Woeseia sp.]